MQMMKAYVRTSGHDQKVELADWPVPAISADEVLVKVRAFGVGIHDRYFIPGNADFPYIIGTEASGEVMTVGANVTAFRVRDRVILTTVLQPEGGCWAEYAVVPQKNLTPLPIEMGFNEGATMPIAGKAALESMRSLNLRSRDTLFVAGASGAIGTLVIQMATREGIRVIGSASARNHDYMLALGAEEAVDYRDPDWKQIVKQRWPQGAVAALAIQPGTIGDAMDVVKDGGKVVAVSGDQGQSKRNIVVEQMGHHDDTQQKLNQLIADIVAGQIRLVIEQVYPFSQAIEALEKTETRHARGKLVVSLANM